MAKKKRSAAPRSKKKKTTTTSKKTTTKKSSTRKKTPAAAGGSVVSAERDKRTKKKIHEMASKVVKSGMASRDPYFDIPTRSVSNTRFNKTKRILEMGGNTQRRNLFNLNQAKKFMQTLLVAKGCRELIDRGKTTSLRGMFYASLHDIAGTKGEKTFNEQSESDSVLEDLEVTVDALREELHIFAKKRGAMVGNITLVDRGDTIDCRRMGSGGYAIPSITEPDAIQFGKCDADFILHVEKDTVWQRFNEDRFWETHNCILTEGSGQPPRGVRRLLHRMHTELKLPVYCLLDCDPWGHYIYSVIKQGSINLAFESRRMAVPEAKFLGIRAEDYERCELSDDVKISLNERDISRAKQIASYPWFEKNRPWQREIKRLLSNGFKMEVEALITKDISYVTEVYVPERLRDADFLD